MLRSATPTDNENEHVVAVPYYNLTNGWNSTVMLSNQGPNQMQAEVVLFGLHGERLNAPPITLEPQSANMFDIRDWATAAFALQQGSLQVHYPGRDRELAGFVKIVRLNQGLIFDEQLTDPEEYFKSSQLEGVYWLPSKKAELSIVISNNTDLQVSTTVALKRSNGKSLGSSTLSLGAHETHILSANEISEEKHETLPAIGGVSVSYAGEPGSVSAEALVQEESTGFSSIIDFRDPQVAVAARLDGAGLRIGTIGGEALTQVAVARNISDTQTIVTGRLVFTTSNGSTGAISIPEERLDPGEAKTLDLAKSIKKSGVSDFDSAGLEFQYTGAPGGVVMTALTVSESGNQVLRVPLVDAQSQKINTGKYPWSIERNSSSVVYLKNVTDEAQEYSMYLRFPDGAYVPRSRRVEAGQTVTIDPTVLRDQQIPDEDGKTIPRTVKQGYLSWSANSTKNLAPGQMERPDNQVIIGRAENVDITNGMSFTGTYGCGCQDSYDDSRIEHQLPNSSWGWAQNSPPMEVFVDETIQLRGRQQDRDGCWNYSEWHSPNTWVGWGSTTIAADDPNGLSVLDVDQNGLANGKASGTARVDAAWGVVRWPPLYECCEYQPDSAQPTDTIQVKGRVSKLQYQNNSGFNDISGTLYGLKGTTVTFKAIPNPESFVWPSGKPVWGGTAGATGTGGSASVTFNTVSSGTSDFKTVTANYGNTVTANIVVYDFTGVVTPANNFSGRSYERFGIEESMSLSFTVAPSLSASQLGGLRWSITCSGSGNGTITASDEGTGTYVAPDTAKSISLALKVLSGPSKDSAAAFNFSIVEPSSGYASKDFSGIRHTIDTWSVGFLGDIHVGPADVSFLNLFFYEGAADVHLSGWLNTNQFNNPHQQGTIARAIDSHNVVNEQDEIWSGQKEGPYGEGYWYWDIPWHILTNSGRNITFTTVREIATSDANGRAVISKGGPAVSRVPSDSTSSW